MPGPDEGVAELQGLFFGDLNDEVTDSYQVLSPDEVPVAEVLALRRPSETPYQDYASSSSRGRWDPPAARHPHGDAAGRAPHRRPSAVLGGSPAPSGFLTHGCHNNAALGALDGVMGVVGVVDGDVGGYEGFFVAAEPRLRRALVARYGFDRGREATADALAWGFEHWDRLRAMDNPTGYLYRVGCTKARGRRRRVLFEAPTPPGDPQVEPELAAALTRLSANQRAAVVLVKGYGWELHEVAELTGLSVSTVNTHVRRGLAKLRTELGVEP